MTLLRRRTTTALTPAPAGETIIRRAHEHVRENGGSYPALAAWVPGTPDPLHRRTGSFYGAIACVLFAVTVVTAIPAILGRPNPWLALAVPLGLVLDGTVAHLRVGRHRFTVDSALAARWVLVQEAAVSASKKRRDDLAVALAPALARLLELARTDVYALTAIANGAVDPVARADLNARLDEYAALATAVTWVLNGSTAPRPLASAVAARAINSVGQDVPAALRAAVLAVDSLNEPR